MDGDGIGVRGVLIKVLWCVVGGDCDEEFVVNLCGCVYELCCVCR